MGSGIGLRTRSQGRDGHEMDGREDALATQGRRRCMIRTVECTTTEVR